MGLFFMRVVSCVPSLSELIFRLCPDQIVGRTKFCILPEEIGDIPKIGGTKTLNISKIASLRPDLVFAVKEENTKDDVEAIQEFASVKVFDIKTIEDALDAIRSIGLLLGEQVKSHQLAQEIERRLASIEPLPRLSALYLIWKKPYMAAANHTYINSVLCRIGLINAAGMLDRYPMLDLHAIRNLKPELILLSSEPFPFSQQDVEELKNDFPNASIHLVDGALFSWYGSHMLRIPEYVQAWLKPEIQKSA